MIQNIGKRVVFKNINFPYIIYYMTIKTSKQLLIVMIVFMFMCICIVGGWVVWVFVMKKEDPLGWIGYDEDSSGQSSSSNTGSSSSNTGSSSSNSPYKYAPTTGEFYRTNLQPDLQRVTFWNSGVQHGNDPDICAEACYNNNVNPPEDSPEDSPEDKRHCTYFSLETQECFFSNALKENVVKDGEVDEMKVGGDYGDYGYMMLDVGNTFNFPNTAFSSTRLESAT
tara:strand:- start:358 stop:1032 length:675 start_codon:yes stop_codon:yes gene_type:complete